MANQEHNKQAEKPNATAEIERTIEDQERRLACWVEDYEHAKAMMKRLTAELRVTREQLEEVGFLPEPDGNCVRISIRFPGSSQVYDYVATRARDRWYFTSQEISPRHWNGFRSWARFKHAEIIAVTELIPVPAPGTF